MIIHQQREHQQKNKLGLDTEQRTLLELTLKKQGLDPDNISPLNQYILRSRQSGIQQRDVGASKGNHTHNYNKNQEKGGEEELDHTDQHHNRTPASRKTTNK